MSSSFARSRQLGDTSETAVIEAVDELEYVPETEDRIDARMRCVFTPGSEVDASGLLVVEKGTPVEIKSCAAVIGEEQARGRWYLRRDQHEYLKENDGLYLFAVSEPHSRDVIAATIVAPNAVEQELISSWIECDEREPYAQIAWSRIFDVSEIEQ